MLQKQPARARASGRGGVRHALCESQALGLSCREATDGERAMKITGFDAISYAEQEGLTLNKDADRIDGPATELSIAEAEAIAADRPELIWLEVSDDDYY